MGQPSNRVALAASSRVHDQVVVPRSLGPSRCLGLAHRIELMVAGENEVLPPNDLSADLALVNFQMDESVQGVEETIAPQNLFPQVGSLVARWILRIARPAMIPLVERQEVRTLPGKASCHVNLVRVNRKMDERALLELEYQVIRIAVVAILEFRVVNRLASHGILEFGCGDGNPVQPEDHVDRKSTRLNSSHGYISYAVFCLKKQKHHHVA